MEPIICWRCGLRTSSIRQIAEERGELCNPCAKEDPFFRGQVSRPGWETNDPTG